MGGIMTERGGTMTPIYFLLDSGVEDNGLCGVLVGMQARGKFVLDHDEGFALSLIEGTTACEHRAYPVYEAHLKPRSTSLCCTCTQEGERNL